MNTISYTSARSHLAETMDGVCADHAPIIITRGKSRPAVVMISLEDYQGMQETNYLLRSPHNAARLHEAINEVETMIKENKKK
jgi:antitoxin YefM